MQIAGPNGKPLDEVTLKLSEAEIADLLVAASQIDDGTTDHSLMRDEQGRSLALYRQTEAQGPLQAGTDWWVGVAVLLLIVLLGVGIYTTARSLLGLIF